PTVLSAIYLLSLHDALPIWLIALVGEEQGAVAGSLDAFEVACGDDQVRIHVAPIEQGDATSVLHERFHQCLVAIMCGDRRGISRSEELTSELQSLAYLVCRL